MTRRVHSTLRSFDRWPEAMGLACALGLAGSLFGTYFPSLGSPTWTAYPVVAIVGFVGAIGVVLALPLLRTTRGQRALTLAISGAVALYLVVLPPMTGPHGESLRFLRQHSRIAEVSRPTPSRSIYVGAACSLGLLLAGGLTAISRERT